MSVHTLWWSCRYSLVPTSIIAGLLKLRNTDEFRRMGGRMLGMFFFTATAASVIGLLVASVLSTGAGMNTAGLSVRETQDEGDLLAQFRGFIPSDPAETWIEVDRDAFNRQNFAEKVSEQAG